MEKEALRKLCNMYISKLEERGVKPKRSDSEADEKHVPDSKEQLSHAYWMCIEAREFITQEKFSKAERWLSLVQGILWINGIRSLEKMRDDNHFQETIPEGVFIGSDHAGYAHKQILIECLKRDFHRLAITDIGTSSIEPCDFPFFGKKVAGEVSVNANREFGILICGTGVGMNLVASAFNSVRSATCNDLYTAELARRHNDINVLCLGARIIAPEFAHKVVKVFLTTTFAGNEFGGERYKKRNAMITAIRNGQPFEVE